MKNEKLLEEMEKFNSFILKLGNKILNIDDEFEMNVPRDEIQYFDTRKDAEEYLSMLPNKKYVKIENI